jgi:hypothetical protein
MLRKATRNTGILYLKLENIVKANQKLFFKGKKASLASRLTSTK